MKAILVLGSLFTFLIGVVSEQIFALHYKDFRVIIIGMTSCFLLGLPTLVPPAAWYRFRYPDGLVPTSLIGGAR